MGKTVGSYDGGLLRYWNHDPGVVDPLLLEDSDAVDLDLSSWTIFDGTLAHQVMPSTGKRFSCIFFTPDCLGLKGETWLQLRDLAFFCPPLFG